MVKTPATTDDIFYCRKCKKILSENNFYDCVDNGLVDANGKMSICKSCIQDLYTEFYQETKTVEKTLHKMCTTLNVKYSNEIAEATKKHVHSMTENGKNVTAVFGIFKSKIFSAMKSMTKSISEDMTYSDMGVVYTSEPRELDQLPIPAEVTAFWGKKLKREEVEYLETQYTNFKTTNKADTYPEIVLLKEVCYTMLEIEKVRSIGESTEDLLKVLQSLMKTLEISPNATSAKNAGKDDVSLGLWIKDLEEFQPAQWLLSDPRGDIYRDVGDTEEYFQKYFVRPTKNFVLGSKDFSIEEEEEDIFEFDDESTATFGLGEEGNKDGKN